MTGTEVAMDKHGGQMKPSELAAVLSEHVRWINGEGGSIANLSRADLVGAYLVGANLSRADLSRANLAGADLVGANLVGANLAGANLVGAKNIPDQVRQMTQIVPDDGAFIGWRKCQSGVLVKVKIPANAKRSNATGRKCRASHVKVLEVINQDGSWGTVGLGLYNGTKYEKGKTVRCHEWDDNRWTECTGGIHFFITRAEAEAYS